MIWGFGVMNRLRASNLSGEELPRIWCKNGDTTCSCWAQKRVSKLLPASSSPLLAKQEAIKPLELCNMEIEEVIIAFINAAKRAQKAGYDIFRTVQHTVICSMSFYLH